MFFRVTQSFELTWAHRSRLNSDLAVGKLNNAAELNKTAILVTSNEDIAVFGLQIGDGNCDAFLALPTDVLGTRYYPVTFWPATTQIQVAVLVTVDGTTVGITFQRDLEIAIIYQGASFVGGDTMTIFLRRYDILIIQSESDLTGTLIEADNPIAVFSGNKFAELPGPNNARPSSHLTEQIPPLGTWGTTFVAFPIPHIDNSATNRFLKFVAEYDNTEINIPGVSTITLRRAGDFTGTNIFIREPFFRIDANKPILAVMYMEGYQANDGSNFDPTMLLLVPTQQV